MVKKVMIVDDTMDNLYMLETLLAGDGIGVISAKNGQDALRRARLDPPDLIITDIMMPVMDGYTLCREWKADDVLRKIPLVFYTATCTEFMDERFALNLGAERLIPKPQKPDVLMGIINDLLNREHSPDDNVNKLLGEEMEFFRHHNGFLFRKLEITMFNLQKANQELMSRDETYRLSFENVSDVIFTIDKDLRITSISPSVSKLLGYAPYELAGRSVHELTEIIAPESLDSLLANIHRILKGEMISGTTYRFIARDGSGKYCEISGSPLMSDSGIVGIIYVARDVTERMRSEEVMRQQQERLDLAQAAGQVGVFDWNMVTDRCLWSPQLAIIFGMEQDILDHAGADWRSRVHPDDQRQADSAIAEALQRKGPEIVNDYRIICPDGDIRWLSNRATILYDASGNAVRMVGTSADITDRRHAEETLRAAFGKMRELEFIVSNTPVVVWVWKAEPGWPVEYVSGNLALFGYEPEDFTSGRVTFPAIVHPDDLERLGNEVKTYSKEGRSDFTQEYRILTKSGDIRWVDDRTLVRMDKDGRPTHYQGIVIDITERKQSEEENKRLQDQLQQAQKMESVGRLAGGVAHDFNNMLGVILGNTEMAIANANAGQQFLQNLEEIQKAAERSVEITRRLLAFARKQKVSPIVLDLNETAAGMLKMIRQLIGEDIHLQWFPGAELWPVMIDPSQVDQILANLCVNARDAISGAGKITIETENVFLDEAYCDYHLGSTTGEYVLLGVSDDGCGMDKETQSRIFEPFFTTKEEGKGTGLGLAMIYGIVKQNKGYISVYSEPGQGTAFKIYLPRHTGEAAVSPVLKKNEPIQRGSETLLLVEDEEALLNLSKTMLELLGYTVLAASHPDEAVKIAEGYPGKIDLLVTDVVMPVMNGQELSEKLLLLYPTIRILFMSGYTSDVLAHHQVLREGVHFLPKPFSPRDMADKVRKALDHDE